MIRSIDWMLLGLQVAVLAAILVRELMRRRNRNLFAMLFAAASLVLIQGQAIWLFSNPSFTSVGYIRHLFQVVTVDGARQANVLLTAATLLFAGALAVGGAVQHESEGPGPEAGGSLPSRRGVAPSGLIAGMFTVVAGFLLISLLGGIGEAVSHPGQSVGGQTLLLIILSIGKLPLFRRLARGDRPAVAEAALFGLCLVLLLFNSRFLTAFVLIQAVLVFNYSYREVSRAVLLRGVLPLFFVFIVYGLYREYATVAAAYGVGDLALFLKKNLTFAAASEWFYRANVEGFVGLGGILTYEKGAGGLHHDLGLSNLSFLPLLIPHALRADSGGVVADFLRTLTDAYPYRGSVVPAGPEIAYANFGVVGVLLWGLLLGVIAVKLHRWSRIGSKGAKVLTALCGVYCLLLVRGTFAAAIFFMIGEVTIFSLFTVVRWFFRRDHFEREWKTRGETVHVGPTTA